MLLCLIYNSVRWNLTVAKQHYERALSIGVILKNNEIISNMNCSLGMQPTFKTFIFKSLLGNVDFCMENEREAIAKFILGGQYVDYDSKYRIECMLSSYYLSRN